MVTKREEAAVSDGLPRMEVEIATLLLGFILVMMSILLTLPNDVIESLKSSGIRVDSGGSITWFPLVPTVSVLTYCFSMLLIPCIPFYMIYLNRLHWKSTLAIARTFLVLGMYGTVILFLLFSDMFLTRFMGMGASSFINPLFGLVYIFGIIISVIWVLVIWVKYFTSRKATEGSIDYLVNGDDYRG